MGNTVVLTLGRLPKALELARSFKRAGWRVVIAEPFAYHLSRPSRSVARCYAVASPNVDRQSYLNDLLEVIAAEDASLVVPVSEEALHAIHLAPILPEGVRLYASSAKTLARLHDKFGFMEWAASLGLRVPETLRVTDERAPQKALAGEYVIKPLHSCSGKGVRFGARGEALALADRAAGQIIQTRIRGQLVSTLSMFEKGKSLIDVVYEGTVFAGTVATAFRRRDDCANVTDWIAQFCALIGYTGFIAFDFIIDDEGRAWPLECNPRMTSGVHFIHPDDLAQCVIGPAPAKVRLRPQTAFQEGHTTLLEVYGSILRPTEFKRRLSHFLRSKDVLFAWDDPLPFVLMTPMSTPILWQVMFQGRSFGDAATHDIEWRGDPEPVALDATGHETTPSLSLAAPQLATGAE